VFPHHVTGFEMVMSRKRRDFVVIATGNAMIFPKKPGLIR
jgi:hypothetical protein